MARRIYILSEQTIDQIAAGEVIENPASVVKELFENAVDAGASHITIETLGGGFQSIRISDNGLGMSEEDALLSLKRHATSKIRSAEDLMQLHTMGFRGEALASIAAISTLTLTTAMQGETGLEVCVKGGTVISTAPSGRAAGTTIEVCSLFYNVPARKKFQKTAAASSAEITRIATLLALAHPHISMELIQQRKEIFSIVSIKNEPDALSLLQKRSADLLGSHFQSTMHRVHFQENGYEIHGLIGDPRTTRYNRSGQYFFINARPVICFPLAFAIRDGYGTRIDSARHPIYVIHVKIDPSSIDVNVHPQKKEIRLREEEAAKRTMRNAIHRALQTGDAPEAWDIAVPSFHFRENTVDEPFFAPEYRSMPTSSIETQIPFVFTEEIRAVGLFGQYLILQAKSLPFPWNRNNGAVWIDLLAARARILFERLICSERKNSSQGLLLPLTFSCSRAEAEKLLISLEVLETVGVQLRCIGETAFIVESIPACLEEREIHNMLQAIISSLPEEGAVVSDANIKHCAQTICRLARSRVTSFSLPEALSVFQELTKTVDPLHCPQGKPTFYHQRQDEIEKYFTRST